MNRLNSTSEYLRQRPASEFLGISEAFLQKLNRLGRGPIRTLLDGSVPIYKVSDLRQWIQDQRPVPSDTHGPVSAPKESNNASHR